MSYLDQVAGAVAADVFRQSRPPTAPPTSGLIKRLRRKAASINFAAGVNNPLGNYPGKRTPRPRPILKTPAELFADVKSLYVEFRERKAARAL